MDVGKTPFFQLLKERLSYLSDRQGVLAENVANANTPGYKPRDVSAKRFEAHVAALLPASGGSRPISMQATSGGHIGGGVRQGFTTSGNALKPSAVVDSETTLDGNAVVLEEQMIKVADTRMQYDTAIVLYQKGLALMRMANRSPSQ